MRKTLLQGGYYIPSHSTDIRETFKRVISTQNQDNNKPLVEKVLNDSKNYFKTLNDFEDLLGPR